MATSGNDVLTDTTAGNAFDGGAGSDTVSYAGAARAVFADLAAGSAYKLVRIMPLGDSITYGLIARNTGNTESGGYRPKLWNALQAQSVTVDFVGSLSNGPTTFDRQHEGHRGWTINQLDAQDASWLATSKPDYVLLMAGTNDTEFDSSTTMVADMRALLASLTNNSPSMTVLVSSIPPIRLDVMPLVRQQRAAAFNAALPGLVSELAGQGRKVSFVDMRDLTTADITPAPADNGLHPTDAGYQKIANHWKAALTARAGLVTGGIGTDKDSFVSIENLTGSANADSLKGNDLANVLSGGAGDDRLDGRNGDDRLVGGLDRDTLTGGGGNDAFVVAARDGHDTITDFTPGGTSDRLEISGYSAVLEKRQVGVDTLVVLSANDDILLKNVSAGALTAADFTFNGVAPPPPPPSGGTIGTAGHDTLVGTAGADVLHGLAGNDSMDGLGGNDAKRGGSGFDTYRFGRGGAVDTIDNDSSDHATSVDKLVFGSDVSRSQLWFQRSGNDLVASVIGTNDRTVLTDWYSEWWTRVDKFQSGDGKTLLSGDVRRLVDAMASFSPPALGQTSLNTTQHAALDPVIAAVWR